MGNNVIHDIVEIDNSNIIKQLNKEVVFKKDELTLGVYDNDNLLGFRLSGNLNNVKNIYIVHDTDNYDRNNPSFKYMYDEVEKDIKHIVKMFQDDEIGTVAITERGLFRKKQMNMVTIPNEAGELREYKSTTVNSTNFFE